jgi:hypothetical protein
MTPAKLNIVAIAAIAIEKQIADLEKQRARFKTELIAEAASRPEEHQPTEGGGKSWAVKNSNGDIVRVTFPGRALKSSISGEGKSIEKIRAAAGNFFTRLFKQAPKYIPVEKFRDEAEALLGGAAGRKLIRLCEAKSQPRVSFEIKDARHAN